jgi:hypothetical protein
MSKQDEGYRSRIISLSSYNLVASLRPVYGDLYEVSITKERLDGEIVRTDVLHADCVRHAKQCFNQLIEHDYPRKPR